MIMGTNIPFTQCEGDSATVDSTGDSLDSLFSNLTRSKCRQILIYNQSGGANLLIGALTADAKFPIPPGSSLTISPKELAKVFAKSAGADLTVAVLAIY